VEASKGRDGLRQTGGKIEPLKKAADREYFGFGSPIKRVEAHATLADGRHILVLHGCSFS
jgi:hypothetical protein